MGHIMSKLIRYRVNRGLEFGRPELSSLLPIHLDISSRLKDCTPALANKSAVQDKLKDDVRTDLYYEKKCT